MSAPSSSNNTLFLLGGTGALGSFLAPGLKTSKGFDGYKAVVRSTESDAAQSLQAMGWNLVQVSDLTDVPALTTALEGAKTVVSTLGKGDLMTLENAAVQAAKAAGATLFVPSQYGVDYRRFGTEFPFLDGKGKVLATAEEVGLPTLKVFVGLFSDFIFGFLTNVDEGTAKLIGDIDGGKISFTKRSDIGFVLARALESDKYDKGGFLSMSSETLTWKEAVAKLSKATGKAFTFTKMTVEQAESLENELLVKGKAGDMGSFYSAFAMHLQRKPASGNTGLDLSAQTETFGHPMEPLDTTLQHVYGYSK